MDCGLPSFRLTGHVNHSSLSRGDLFFFMMDMDMDMNVFGQFTGMHINDGGLGV